MSTKPLVRLLSFQLKGGSNDLLNLGFPDRSATDKQILENFHCVGAKFWFLPESASSFEIGKLPAKKCGVEGLRLTCESEILSSAEIQVRTSFILDPVLSKIVLTGTLINTSNGVRKMAGWWPVAVRPTGILRARPQPRPGPPKLVGLTFWPGTTVGAGNYFEFCDAAAELRLEAPLKGGRFKVGLQGDKVELITSHGRCTMGPVAPPPAPDAIYPYGCSIILYRDDRAPLAEAEFCGPLVDVIPGGELTFSIQIELQK